MQLKPAQLAPHLKQPLRPLYVVAGDEPLLIQEALDALRRAARAQGYSEREVLDADRSFDWSRLTQAAASLSLFASRRLIEVNLSGSGPGDAGGKALKELAQAPVPDTVIVLICGALEWSSRKSGWYTALENAGASLYLEAVTPAQLPGWIGARLKASGVSATPDAVQLLAERTEGNLLAAAQDVEKLKLLYPGQTVSEAQVRGAVADSARFEAFDLVDKVLGGDAAGAVRSLGRLREEGAELPMLLGAWAYMLRQWALASAHYAQSRNAAAAGRSPSADQLKQYAAAACEVAGIWRSRQEPYLKALPRARPAQVYGWLARCARMDLSAKSSRAEEAWEELLTCVVAASSAAT